MRSANLGELQFAGKVFPENRFIRSSLALKVATLGVNRKWLNIIDKEIINDPYAIDLLYVSLSEHLILNDIGK
jgi:hypothetical protein